LTDEQIKFTPNAFVVAAMSSQTVRVTMIPNDSIRRQIAAVSKKGLKAIKDRLLAIIQLLTGDEVLRARFAAHQHVPRDHVEFNDPSLPWSQRIDWSDGFSSVADIAETTKSVTATVDQSALDQGISVITLGVCSVGPKQKKGHHEPPKQEIHWSPREHKPVAANEKQSSKSHDSHKEAFSAAEFSDVSEQQYEPFADHNQDEAPFTHVDASEYSHSPIISVYPQHIEFGERPFEVVTIRNNTDREIEVHVGIPTKKIQSSVNVGLVFPHGELNVELHELEPWSGSISFGCKGEFATVQVFSRASSQPRSDVAGLLVINL
jgi:hypothetical protein